MGLIFIISTTGIFIYKTHCECIGTEQVAFYVKPDTCETDSHHCSAGDNSGIETEENCCGDCHAENHDCGCNSPEVNFIILKNQFSNDEMSYLKTPQSKILVLTCSLLISNTETVIDDENTTYIDPPPKIFSSRTFLIEVNQLKIPFSA